jgi:hypothetical protein
MNPNSKNLNSESQVRKQKVESKDCQYARIMNSRPTRKELITQEEITNLIILLNTTKDVLEFIAKI